MLQRRRRKNDEIGATNRHEVLGAGQREGQETEADVGQAFQGQEEAEVWQTERRPRTKIARYHRLEVGRESVRGRGSGEYEEVAML